MNIKIITQRCTTAQGACVTYGVIVDGMPRCMFTTKAELKAFMKGLCGEIKGGKEADGSVSL